MAKRRRSSASTEQDAATREQKLAAAKRRALTAKTGASAFAMVVFVVGMVAAQKAYAGHAKEPITPLAAPPRYVRIVKKNLLQAGVVGPAQAPPGAASAAS
jgi:hypothetical protein